MFKVIKKYRAANIIELEVYKFDGTLVFIKRVTSDIEAESVMTEIKRIELKLAKAV